MKLSANVRSVKRASTVSRRPRTQWRVKLIPATEAQIQSTICDWLDLEKLAYTVTDGERSWNRSGSVRRKRRIRPGWPDITLVIVPHGRAVFFEVKSKTGKLSANQSECHKHLRDAGASVYVVRSLEDAQAAIKRERSGLHTWRGAS